jgi:creatinine amidohydrolase
MYLSDLTWPDVEAQLARDDRLILVTGATEQHGRHLPLGTDNLIPLAIAERISHTTGVPIAPPVNYGMSEYFMGFPGTFTLTEDTLRALYLELLQSSYRQGWRRLFVVNGHGGNRSAWEWSAALAAKVKPDLKIYIGHWWTEESVRDLTQQWVGRNEGHAGLEETAAALVARSDLVRLNEATGDTGLPADIWSRSPADLRAAWPTGAAGLDPSAANADLGEALIAAVVGEYLALIDGTWSP